MPEFLSADRTAELLLWYFKEPGRYRAEGRRRDAPLLDAGVVLKLALGRRVDFARHAFNEARTLATLRDAAALYVRFLFFRPDATPYQILGLAPGASAEAIKENFRLLMHLVHPDRQDARLVWPDSFAAQANRAYGILKDQDTRVKFDREAEARAAMARAISRSATASVASKMPVVPRPRPRLGRGRALPGPTLPEWLTVGVGGLARNHPSATAFAALVGAAALSVGAMVWDRHEEALMRDVDAGSERSTATSFAGPRLSWFGAPKPSAPAPMASQGGASAERSPPAETKPPGRGVKSAASDAPVSLASTGQPVSAVSGSPAPGRVPDTGARQSASVALDPPEGNTASPRAATAEAAAPAPPPAVASAVAAGVSTAVAKTDPAPASPPQVAGAEPPSAPAASAGAAMTSVVTHAVVATAAPGTGSPGAAAMTAARADVAVTAVLSPVAPAPPATSEIETLFAMFVESYERGRVDAFSDLFDVEAEANLRQGRTAIRGEYDELFRLSQWRKMQLTRVNWKRVGNRAVAKGEITVRIGWRDGREVEQRLAMDMELVRRDGRVVIARMSQQPRN